MATNRTVLFQLVGTLCFVLLMLNPAAYGEQLGGVVLYAIARCKSNPSITIKDATTLQQVTIDGTMVATAKTTEFGELMLVVNVTSEDQLVALFNKEPNITASSKSCGDVEFEIIGSGYLDFMTPDDEQVVEFKPFGDPPSGTGPTINFDDPALNHVRDIQLPDF